MCDFKVPHSGNTEAMLSKLKHVVAKNNGTLTETETGGSFTMNTMLGSIAEDYTLLSDAVAVSHTHLDVEKRQYKFRAIQIIVAPPKVYVIIFAFEWLARCFHFLQHIGC